jgi:predicted nucleotide-binding protein (sugar kinase/HSP70/actin superfamily)
MESEKVFRINFDKKRETTPIKKFTFNYQPKIERLDNFTYKSHCNIVCLIQEKYEELIYSNLMKIAEEEGVSEVVVIDREFVKTALINEIERRKENEHRKSERD